MPSEPWDSQGSDFSTSESEASESPRPSHFRRPSNLETIRDSRFYNAAGLLSNGDSEDTSSEEAGPSSLMPPSVPPLDTTFTLPPQTELDQTFPIVAVPQLPRTRSEPVPSSRHAFDFGSHSRESSGDTVSSSSSVSLFSSHYLTTSPESLVSCDSSYTSLFSRRRTNTHSIINDELSSTLEYDYSDAVLSLNPSSSSLLSISQSSSSNDVSSEEVGYSNQAISENFEPGTSADTIRSVPIHHQRSVSNLSETLVDWTPTQSELLLSPTRSTSSSDRSSGVSGRGLQPSCEMMSEGSEEYGGGYGADFISFNSDSSEEEDGEEEEHLPCSTPLSRSSSSIGGEERGVRRMSSGSTVFSAWSLRTPQNSLYEVGEDQNATFDFDDDDDDVEEEEEVCLEERRDETERISVLYSPIHQTFVQDPSTEEAVDAGEGSGKGYSSSRYDGHSSSHGDYGRWNAGNNNNGSNGGGGGSSWGGGNGFSGAGGGGGGGRRGNDGDDQWRRRPSGRALVPATSKDSDTSEDEEQDDHSEETHSPRPVKSQVKQVNSSAISSDDDDDVPLAQQIPTALKAQKTIRRQVRDERAQRREERRQRAERSSPASHVRSFVSTTATTTTTAGITERSPPSSRAQAGQPQDGSTSLSRVPSQARPTTRPRTRTLPSKPTSPYVLQDLTAKLLDVQVGTSGNGNGSRSRRPSAERPTPPTTITTIATAHRSRGESNRPSIEGSPNHFSSRTQQQPQQQQPQLQVDNHLVPPPRSPAVDGYMIEGGVRPRNNLLRPSKSFHRPRTANGEIEHMVPPVPFDSKVKLSRSATTIGKQRVQHDVHPPTTFSPSFSPFAASHREREREREREEVGLERGKSMRTTSSRAPSFERSRRSSNDHNYDGYPSSPRPPLPHRPSAEVVPPHSSSSLPSHSPHLPPPPPQQKAEPTWQQRIFVGTLQRFCQVEVGGSTMAGDVLRILEGQAVFPDGSRKGWMMWEICQDFGMGE